MIHFCAHFVANAVATNPDNKYQLKIGISDFPLSRLFKIDTSFSLRCYFNVNDNNDIHCLNTYWIFSNKPLVFFMSTFRENGQGRSPTIS